MCNQHFVLVIGIAKGQQLRENNNFNKEVLILLYTFFVFKG